MKVAISSLAVLFALAGLTIASRPNIVLLLADDLGFADLGCYGGEIRTPNVDRLAQEGIRFTQFYSAARCCPTRSALLTGLHPHQAGMGHMTYDGGQPGYRGELSSGTVTLAEVLRAAGYQTLMCGKWHLTHRTATNSIPDQWPRQRGFERFFGTLPGYGSFWNPAGLMLDNSFIESEGDFFYTDAISATAVDWVATAARNKAPFFLYAAYTAPHYPLHARSETIASYDGFYYDGWEETRRRRYQRQLELGLFTESTKLSPRDEASIDWVDEPEKSWQSYRMQTYAAMVEEMDRGIGSILDALDQSGIADNTLIVFLSDNGGSCEGHRDNKIERLDKPWVSKLIPTQTRDGRPVRAGDFPDMLPGPADTFGSYGLRWASVSNTPFRRHKSWVHEGGISVPCVVRWPDKVKDPGSIRHDVAHVIDVMPTLCDIAQTNYPASLPNAGGGQRPVTPAAGTSLLPVFVGKSLPSRILCWEHEGNRAVRSERWKLVSEFPGSWSSFYPYEKKGRWELYDINNDRSELNDRAVEQPQTVARLSREYDAWARRCQVIPWEELSTKRP